MPHARVLCFTLGTHFTGPEYPVQCAEEIDKFLAITKLARESGGEFVVTKNPLVAGGMN